jgi:hypothetical protein
MTSTLNSYVRFCYHKRFFLLSRKTMQNSVEQEQLKSDLRLPWIMVGLMLALLVVSIVVCQSLGEQLQQGLPGSQRVVIRTVLYVIAIITFPVTNLIRHIQLRLNQTMPGNESAKSRYLLTIVVSLSLIESVGIFGFVMFVLGDDFNTLYIFTTMSALGLFLHRPKPKEYEEIVAAMAARSSE